MTEQRLREDARQIWQSGVAAVDSERLVRQAMSCDGLRLSVCGHEFECSKIGRIAVVGAGKAGAGMASAVEAVLANGRLLERTTGWVNVPSDCVRPLQFIHLHAARPPGVNEPTQAGVEGTRRILEIVQGLTSVDLCLVILSGGGSALLPAPKTPFTLSDKRAVTRFLMHAGATIHELNTVRIRMSEIKGGGLARACRAGTLIALIISDVVGDPLDLIASGPTYPSSATDADALSVLNRFAPLPPELTGNVIDTLRRRVPCQAEESPFPCKVFNHIIGHNQTALDAAAVEANRLGYQVVSLGSDCRGEANEEGRRLAQLSREIRDDRNRSGDRVCLLSGGEPIVHLSDTHQPRKGGRNQQLVLAGVNWLQDDGMRGMALLSGGTDGEDGPTDAAGACADAVTIQSMRALHLDPGTYLERNDAYTFFDQVGGLLKTGPTHTNVMDLRVALIDR